MIAKGVVREVVVESTRSVTAMLGGLDETTWELTISPVGWDWRFTIEHIGGDLLHYAGQVAQQPTDHYVAFSFDQSRAKTHAGLVETVEMAGRLLAAAVSAAPDESTAWHPQGMFTPAGFAAMGACEALVHGYDIAVSLGLDWTPDDDLSRLVTDFFFPAIPSAVRTANSPTAVLAWATGRKSLAGVDDVVAWDYRAALPSPA
jgi:uncharacterized protein (TIGR03083 family)